MPSVLRAGAISSAERNENNEGSRASIVLAVFAFLAIYAYLFCGPGGLDSNVSVALTDILPSNAERLVLFASIFAIFAASYYAKVELKRPILSIGAFAVMLALYGMQASLGFVFAHGLVYATLHPVRGRPHQAGALLGLAGYAAFRREEIGLVRHALEIAAVVPAAAILYRLFAERVLSKRIAAAVAREIVVQSAMICCSVGAVIGAMISGEIILSLGLLLFFWQWERLIMYHIDYKDGLVPDDQSFAGYLSIFLTPAALPNWNWGVAIGQGYKYLDGAFLSRPKNDLVMSGLRLWALALAYLVLGDWARDRLVDAFTGLGVDVHRARITRLVEAFMSGREVTSASVLATSFLDVTRWIMLWAGVVHFKVGVWRVCGFSVDPYFDKPYLATNLVSFWARFTFHYREFLVRAFYYPVFFRCFRRHKNLRVFMATMAAACAGNLVWGHVSERLFYRGLALENIGYVFGTWPYFACLGVGIGLTQIFLLHRRRWRKPWSFGWGIALDVAAAYATVQFYALITIFARPASGSTAADLARLVLRGLGIG
jgi:hypothetical protein